jgi:hypothetical protein
MSSILMIKRNKNSVSHAKADAYIIGARKSKDIILMNEIHAIALTPLRGCHYTIRTPQAEDSSKWGLDGEPFGN